MTTDMSTLTGAYAVNALNDAERAEFEQHLSTCPDCAQEVDELRATAARLSAETAATPPAELKQRVLAEIARTRQHSPQPPTQFRTVSRRTRWRPATALATAAAVLGVALAGVFGGIAWHTQRELAQTQQKMERAGDRGTAMHQMLGAPDARMSQGSAGTAQATTVVSQQLGKVMLLGSNMSPPPPGRAYQAWFIGQAGPTSAGMLDMNPSRDTTSVIADMPSGAERMAITVEPAGGSPQPTTDPVMMVPMPR